MPLTPQQVAEKWATNYSNAGKAFEDGINGIEGNPFEKAIAHGDAYLAGVQKAFADKKWENALRRVNVDAWKRKTIKLGKSRMAEGAAEAKDKMAKFMTVWMPKMIALRAKIRAMPKATKAQRKERMTTAFEENYGFVYQK